MKKRREHRDSEGLERDVRRTLELAERRRVLRLLAGASLVPLFGCDGGGDDRTIAPVEGASATEPCEGTIPLVTVGQNPADGSNGPNILNASGIVRSDIRSSFAGLSGIAEGVPMTTRLTIVNAALECVPLAGLAVYLWHCDRAGQYSIYSRPDQNYLRGVQPTDAAGVVTFTSIFPACYLGRWPHLHFEVYASIPSAVTSTNSVWASQIAMPEETCNVVYATTGYEQSVQNLSQVSLDTDNVFSAGVSLQMPIVTGTVESGFLVELTVGIAV